MIYIHDPNATVYFMGFVRVGRNWEGKWYVIEGLTNR